MYNEEATIGACLDAIAEQTVFPDEVIVVDNNSTDRTAAVVRKYPFARVIKESRQGVIYARNRGFDTAQGEVVGRIDADTRLAPDWVEMTLGFFEANPQAAAMTGSMSYHSVPLATLFNVIDKIGRRLLSRVMRRRVAIQGANMALRAEAWRRVRPSLCHQGGMHEDFDIGIHLTELGMHVRYITEARATVAFRQALGSWDDFYSYVMLSPHTYRVHGVRRYVLMYPLVGLALFSYPLLHMITLGYDESTGGFSLLKFISRETKARVNPATFVD